MLSCQPHLKSKVQSRDSDSDSVSDEEGQEDALAHQVLGTMRAGLPRVYSSEESLQAALQVARSQRSFILCLRDWILIALAYNRGFKTTPWIGEWASSGAFKKLKRGKISWIVLWEILITFQLNNLPQSPFFSFHFIYFYNFLLEYIHYLGGEMPSF
jgi:hypothetical protein